MDDFLKCMYDMEYEVPDPGFSVTERFTSYCGAETAERKCNGSAQLSLPAATRAEFVGITEYVLPDTGVIEAPEATISALVTAKTHTVQPVVETFPKHAKVKELKASKTLGVYTDRTDELVRDASNCIADSRMLPVVAELVCKASGSIRDEKAGVRVTYTRGEPQGMGRTDLLSAVSYMGATLASLRLSVYPKGASAVLYKLAIDGPIDRPSASTLQLLASAVLIAIRRGVLLPRDTQHVTVPFPEYVSSSGELITAVCLPWVLSEYG